MKSEQNSISLKVKFLSTLKSLVGFEDIKIQLKSGNNILNLLELLEKSYFVDKKENILLFIDKGKKKLSYEVLVLLNNAGISVYDGLNTVLEDNDCVTLISSIHGG